MSANIIFFAWNRSIPGREQISAGHFQEFVGYLGELQGKGGIQSFETVFLNAHGGDLNGFFLIHGNNDQLNQLQASEAWTTHMTRAALHLEGSGAVTGVSGDLVMERMALWTKSIPG